MEKNHKCVTLSQIKNMDWKDKRVVLVGGAFDILHQGHIAHLADARSRGDVLVVHITGDRRLREKKGREPIFTAKERALIISALACVDHVFIYEGRHYDKKVLEAVRPAMLYFNTEAYTDDVKRRLSEKDMLGIRVFVSKKSKVNSSSYIIDRLKCICKKCGAEKK